MIAAGGQTSGCAQRSRRLARFGKIRLVQIGLTSWPPSTVNMLPVT
jgi:hypothetical protein